MTETAAQPVAAEVDAWLERFESALTEGDTAAAAELFPEDSFWRDLVAFTWNLKTVEGRAGVKDMLDAHARRTRSRAAGARPSRRPRPTAITEAWIEFETEVGRGRGHLRLRDGKAWTLLTDALRAQGPRGAARRRAPARASSTAPTRDRETWLEAPRARGARARLRRRSPTS